LQIKPVTVLKKYFSVIILLFPTLLFAILYVKTVSKLEKANEQLKAAQVDQDRLNHLELKTTYEELKSKADELFIMGNYDDALLMYNELQTPDAQDIIKHRTELAAAIMDDNNGSSESIQHREQQIRSLKLELELLQNEILNSMLINSDSIQSLNAKLISVTTMLNKAKLELENSRKDSFTFKTPKGYTVRYLGQVKNGKANGNGVGLWDSGSFYEGEWSSNMRHGKGTFEWADGEKYEGNYLNDQRSGFGKYYWKNGERYEGEWLNDQRNGQGTIYDKKGNVKVAGVWKNDEPLSNTAKNGNP
jgi:hypothetical protein